MGPVKIGLSFDDKKSPSGIPEGILVSCGLSLPAISIAIISATGLPVARGGAVRTLRNPALRAGSEVSVIVLPDIVVRSGIMGEPMVANA